ncbi:hypothetical protein JOD18_002613 [Gracilibacillus alcaliphilus]|nr:hypothetical protein [Gracilibacillus alcaliphilus]
MEWYKEVYIVSDSRERLHIPTVVQLLSATY